MDEDRLTISIVEVDEQDDKTIIDFEIGDEFHEWFLNNHCVSRRFNKKSFRGWMRRALHQALVTLDKGPYLRVYSKMSGRVEGICKPEVGDLIVFFNNGYRTRIISKVTKNGVEFEKLFEGDTYRRIGHDGIFEITRPRAKRAGSTS